jgi:hypothetical protein
MANHPNRKRSHVALTPLERDALLGVLDNAIQRMKAVGRDPRLLLRIREKIVAIGDIVPRDQGQE